MHRRCDVDLDEIDLEFMEQEAEERLTLREALLLGLPSDPERQHIASGENALLLIGLD